MNIENHGTETYSHVNQVKYFKLIYIFSVYFRIDKCYKSELIFVYFQTNFKLKFNLLNSF